MPTFSRALLLISTVFAAASLLGESVLRWPAAAWHRPAAADSPTGAPAATAFVTVRGKQLIEPSGQPLLIRGISLGNWLVPEGYMFEFKKVDTPHAIYAATKRLLGAAASARFWRDFRARYVTDDDIRFIASLGFNVVRVPLDYRLFMTEGAPPDFLPTFDGEGWALLDRVITWSRAAGLRVIIDLHAAPGGQTGANHDNGTGYPLLFYVPRYQSGTVSLWREIAARYAGEPAVLGYELLNEPIAPYHDTMLLNPRLEPLYRRIVAAIREVDHNHIVFLSGSQWSSSFRMFGPPFDAKTVYTYHQFWSEPVPSNIREYVDFANRYQVPIWVGETGELTDAWNRAFRQLNERHGIGWSFWTYKNFDTPSSVVSIRRPSFWDRVIRAVDEPPPAGTWSAQDIPVDNLLANYLDNVDLARCNINEGYITSLGLTLPCGRNCDQQAISALSD